MYPYPSARAMHIGFLHLEQDALDHARVVIGIEDLRGKPFELTRLGVEQ